MTKEDIISAFKTVVITHPNGFATPHLCNEAAILIEQQAETIRGQAKRIAELEKDKARLDWLQPAISTDAEYVGHLQRECFRRHITFREAIDGAMNAAMQPKDGEE